MPAAGDPINISDLDDATPQLIGEVTVTTDSGTFTTIIELASLTVNLVSGQNYELRLFGHMGTSTAGTNVILSVTDTTTAGTELAAAQVNCPTTSTVGFAAYGVNDYSAAATGAKTFKLCGRSNTGVQLGQLRASSTRKARLQVWSIPA